MARQQDIERDGRETGFNREQSIRLLDEQINSLYFLSILALDMTIDPGFERLGELRLVYPFKGGYYDA